MIASQVIDRLPARVAVPLRARLGHRDPEVGHLHRFVSRGDTVLDVGAHKGSYTSHLARLVGPTGRVHAFEPQKELAARLRSGSARQVTVHAFGLSDQNSLARLIIPVWGSTIMRGHATFEQSLPDDTSRVCVVAETRRLDALELAPVFIKADVEGHEAAMLRGAEETIERNRPVLLIEIDFRHHQEDRTRHNLLDLLVDLKYSAHYVRSRGELVSFGRLVADRDPNGVIGQRSYVYNWFMLPA